MNTYFYAAQDLAINAVIVKLFFTKPFKESFIGSFTGSFNDTDHDVRETVRSFLKFCPECRQAERCLYYFLE